MAYGHRTRDPRIKVMLSSRIRVGATWSDACIHNLSRRGLLIGSADPPLKGSYIEVRRGSTLVVGRVVWREGRFFGVRAQDNIDVAALQSDTRAAPTVGADGAVERRAKRRPKSAAAFHWQFTRARWFGKMVEFSAIALVALLAAMFVAGMLYEFLDHALGNITRALAGEAA